MARAVFDHYKDVQERLDRQELDRPEPPAHQLAREQLAKAGIRQKRIIRACPEAILFVNDSDVVMTAWSEIRQASQAVVFYCETGMPAWPSA